MTLNIMHVCKVLRAEVPVNIAQAWFVLHRAVQLFKMSDSKAYQGKYYVLTTNKNLGYSCFIGVS